MSYNPATNKIELDEDTIIKLQELIIEIDDEESKADYDEIDEDVVCNNIYNILDIVRKLVLNTETKIPTVTLEIPLYEYDDDDNMVPLEGERLEETISEITSVDEVRGFAVGNYKVTR